MGETLSGAAVETPAAAQTADSRILRTAILPGVLLLTGVIVTFTPTLHENTRANELTAGTSLLALALAILVRVFPRGSKQEKPAYAKLAAAATCLVSGVSVLVGEQNGTLPLWLHLAIASGLLAILQLPGLRNGGSYYLLFSAIALAVAEVLVGKDPVAAIGWFGALTVVSGVFSAIEVADARMRSGAKTENR